MSLKRVFVSQAKRFIALLYFKNFIILFFALEIFFTGIDLMQNFKNLPDSANLQILYTTNIFLYFINFTLPLSLIFAMISSIFQIINSNELVALYSLGVSKQNIIKPIVFISLIITFTYIMLNATGFVKAGEYARNIKKYGEIERETKNLFLKSHDNYVYIETLFPIKKEGQNITIFTTQNGDLTGVLKAKKAIFKGNYWELFDVKKLIKPIPITKDSKLTFQNIPYVKALEGFKPEIIDNLFKGRSKLNIQNSISAITLLNEQNINTDKIRGNLYLMLFFPLFAPIVILTLFYPMPIMRRGSNMGMLSSLYIFGVLILWGLFFTLAKISTNGSILPELGILLPMVILTLASFYIINKKR